jgi:hypothetical protein
VALGVVAHRRSAADDHEEADEILEPVVVEERAAAAELVLGDPAGEPEQPVAAEADST